MLLPTLRQAPAQRRPAGCLFLLLMLGACAQAASAQTSGLQPAPGILRNSVTTLEARGDTLWAGPFLNATSDGGATWQVAAGTSGADSLFGTRNRVFSLDARRGVVWAGLGFTSPDEGRPAAAGFLASYNGGRTFTYRLPPLDLPGDTLVRYGVNTLTAVPVVDPDESPPYDVAYDPSTGAVYTAGALSGLRRSDDRGITWQRVVLPPDDLDAIFPQATYAFELSPKRVEDPAQHWNHVAYSVLVDETGTLWAGTLFGVNRSRPEDVDEETGGRAWQRTRFDGSALGLTGSWVIALAEQPVGDDAFAPGTPENPRNPVWMATWNADPVQEGGQDGITVTRDGGETFEQVLRGVTVSDFAFGPDGTVYAAAGEEGLLVSSGDGLSWQAERVFPSPDDPDRVLAPDLAVNAVTLTDDALWVGTTEGLFRQPLGEEGWQLFRTNVPLTPTGPITEIAPESFIPEVETYAYPNPFSPNADGVVRIRYAVDGSTASVDVQIFDFGMNLVRRLVDDETQSGGEREVAWDGTDDHGLRVANGPYFYTVEAGGGTAQGKILVLE